MTNELINYDEMKKQFTTDLLIEKTNDPDAEVDNNGDCWANGAWLHNEHNGEEQFAAWIITHGGIDNVYVNDDNALGEKHIGTQSAWESHLTAIHTGDDGPLDEYIDRMFEYELSHVN